MFLGLLLLYNRYRCTRKLVFRIRSVHRSDIDVPSRTVTVPTLPPGRPPSHPVAGRRTDAVPSIPVRTQSKWLLTQCHRDTEAKNYHFASAEVPPS